MNKELRELKDNITSQLDSEEVTATEVIEKNRIAIFSISYKGSIVTIRFNSVNQNLVAYLTSKKDDYIIKESLKNIISLSIGASPDTISEDGDTISWWEPFYIENVRTLRKQKKSQIS